MNTEHDASPITEPAEERITLRMQVHVDAPSHGIVLREGPKPTRVRGRIPRIARLLALAHHFQELLETGVVRTQMETRRTHQADDGTDHPDHEPAHSGT